MTYLKPYAVSIDGTQVNGVTSAPINAGLTTVAPLADGQIDPSIVSKLTARPRFNFSTLDLNGFFTALGFAGVEGVAITYMQAVDSVGAIAGSGHVTHTLANALIVPRTVAASQDGNASASAECIGLGVDGGYSAATGALPALSGVVDKIFSVGKVSIGGTVITGVQSISVDFGLSVNVVGSDGNIGATHASVTSRLPKISITTVDIDGVRALFSGGDSLELASPAIVYFRKRLACGTYVADGTAEHIKITVTEGCVVNQTAQGGNPGTASFMIDASKASGSDIVIVSAASAVT